LGFFEVAVIIYHARMTMRKSAVTGMPRTKARGILHKQSTKGRPKSGVYQDGGVGRQAGVWGAYTSDDLLFISKEHGIISANHKKTLVRVKYRGLYYYKYPGTSKRISEKSIKNKTERCNVII